jgi:hypothetical protein
LVEGKFTFEIIYKISFFEANISKTMAAVTAWWAKRFLSANSLHKG